MGDILRLFRELVRRVRFRRNRATWEQELDEEMRFHIEMRERRTAEAGIPAQEARTTARRRFGNPSVLREESREAWVAPWLEAFVQDSRIAFRSMGRNPGYAFLGAGTLAIAIGACTAVFTLGYSVLLKPLPYQDADQLVMIYEDRSSQGFPRGDTSPANYRQLRSDTRSYRDMAMLHRTGATLDGISGESERVDGGQVTPNFFDVIGVRPALGRFFRSEEAEQGRDNVVVLGYELWQRSFGGDRTLIGRSIRLNEQTTTVIGILPPHFQFLYPEAEVWQPIAFGPATWARRDLRYLHIVGRLRDGVTVANAQAELDALNPRLREAAPVANLNFKAVAIPLRRDLTGDVRNRVLLLGASVLLVLLIGCVNVAHLMLSRSVRRASELAVRLSLGANRGRLVRQLLTESIAISFAGGAAGLLLAVWSLRVLRFLVPDSIAAFTTVEAGPGTAAIAFALAAISSVVSGLLPAVRLGGVNWHEAVKQGSSRVVGGFGQERLRGVLVMSEVALAVLLVVGASLMVRTLLEVLHVNPGFDAEGVLTAVTNPPRPLRSPEARTNYLDTAVARLRSLPGVTNVAFVSAVPFTWKGGKLGFDIVGRLREPEQSALNRQITPDYFRTLRIPLRSGREFTADDRAETHPVAIVNETLVNKYFPGESALGRRILVNGPGFTETQISIVGVAGDVKEMGLLQPAQPIIYLPHSQAKADFNLPFQVAIRTDGDPALLVSAMRGEFNAGWPGMPVSKIQKLSTLLEKEMADRRPMATLAAGLAAVALLLACVGIYGLLAFSVAQRLPEIGIRHALGASPARLLREIMGKGLSLSAAGIVVGVLASLAFVQLLRGVLYGVRPLDPVTFLAAPAVVFAIALAAAILPARSALRVDPAQALRSE